MWSCHVSAMPATWLWGSSRAEAVPLYFRVTSLHVTAKAFVMDLDLLLMLWCFCHLFGGAESGSSERSLFLVPSRVGFLHLSCGDIWARCLFTVGCPVPWRVFSSVPGLHPPDAGSTTTPAVKVKNASRHCQCPSGDKGGGGGAELAPGENHARLWGCPQESRRGTREPQSSPQLHRGLGEESDWTHPHKGSAQGASRHEASVLCRIC